MQQKRSSRRLPYNNSSGGSAKGRVSNNATPKKRCRAQYPRSFLRLSHNRPRSAPPRPPRHLHRARPHLRRPQPRPHPSRALLEHATGPPGRSAPPAAVSATAPTSTSTTALTGSPRQARSAPGRPAPTGTPRRASSPGRARGPPGDHLPPRRCRSEGAPLAKIPRFQLILSPLPAHPHIASNR